MNAKSRTVTRYAHAEGVKGKSTKKFYTGLHQEEEAKEEDRDGTAVRYTHTTGSKVCCHTPTKHTTKYL